MSIETLSAIMIVAMFSFLGYSSYAESEVKKSCYEAMQYNPKLQCSRP